MTRTSALVLTAASLAALAALSGGAGHPSTPAPSTPAAAVPGRLPAPPRLSPPAVAAVPAPVVASSEGSLQLTGTLTSAFVQAGRSQATAILSLTGKDAPKRAHAKRPAVNLALALDRSGSMAGSKLVYAKQAADALIDRLGPDDRLTIIHYGSDVTELRPAWMSPAGRAAAHAFVGGIHEEGGTNIYQALDTAAGEVARGMSAFKSNRVVFLTDGVPTEGNTDPAAIVGRVRAIHERGITVSAIGIGADFNGALLRGMVEVGAGAYGYLEDTSQLAHLLENELEQATTTVAASVVLELQPAPGVHFVEVVGHTARREGGTWTVPLQDFTSGAHFKFVSRFEVDSSVEHPQMALCSVRLRYLDTLRDARAEAGLDLAVQVTAEQAVVAANLDRDAEAVSVRAEGAKLMEQAAQRLEQGDREGASSIGDAVRQLFGSSAAALTGSDLSNLELQRRAIATCGAGTDCSTASQSIRKRSLKDFAINTNSY